MLSPSKVLLPFSSTRGVERGSRVGRQKKSLVINLAGLALFPPSSWDGGKERKESFPLAKAKKKKKEGKSSFLG